MGKRTTPALPTLAKLLAKVGENIRLARLRRKFPTTLIAQRAGMSRQTLYDIERGKPTVAFGAYANVLLCLGLEKDLETIARDDVLGRQLSDADLAVKKRAPRRKRNP